MSSRRVPTSLTVLRTEEVTKDLVRVVLGGEQLDRIPDLTFTDHYVKLLFAPPGAGYAWPFDPEEVRETLPREQWPVLRTYTIRSLDREAGELAIDFVVHGDAGIAGPWAAAVQPGEEVGFLGPGGAWAPEADADVHLFVGDESAAPAIAAGLEALPEGARAEVFIEIGDDAGRLPLRDGPQIRTTWISRADHGGQRVTPLTEAVRAAEWPTGRVCAFVHGNAAMIKDLRRYLFIERELPRDQVSISGYWRTGHDENAWQASKRTFLEELEREETQQSA